MKNASLEGRNIAYIDEVGSGEQEQTILLIHGFASGAMMNWKGPGWIEVLVEEGYRVIALDNRGHGESTKFYKAEAYSHGLMAKDGIDLLDALEIEKAHVMGYSMGAGISSVLASNYPDRVEKLILAGNGYNLIEPSSYSEPIRDALLAPSLEDVTTPIGQEFRLFAEVTKSDLEALAACIMGVRKPIVSTIYAGLKQQVLVIAGSEDDIAVTPEKLTALIPNGYFKPIPKRNHMNAVGDKIYKQEVLKFLMSEV